MNDNNDNNNNDDKKINVNRRDFISGGVGAILGASLIGINAAHNNDKPSSDAGANTRNPASTTSDPRNLANNHSMLQKHYPVLIIGSGYGGSVLAARLSATGKKVCILERGKEWHPGMFPTNEAEMGKAGRTPFSPRGLLDSNLHVKSDVDVICASGLGGTSLLNAAIASRPEALVFQQKVWPKRIREDFESGKLSKYMDKAQGILHSTKHPDAMKMDKTKAFQQMASKSNLKTEELFLNVNHSKDTAVKNAYGIPQNACTMCGDCCSGCNVGAKNVLTVNYLPIAKSQGTEIYTLMEVTYIEKDASNRYTVNYIYYGGLIPLSGKLTTDLLIVSAGSMGSSSILLKSRFKGLRLSQALGTRFSANGDVMGLSYNGNTKINMVSNGLKLTDTPVGQSIMVYTDFRTPYKDPSMVDLMERFLLLDGTIPSPIAPLIARTFANYAKLNPDLFTKEQMDRVDQDFLNYLSPGNSGALGNSLIFFGCGHDSSNGRYHLDSYEDKVHVKWSNVVNEKGFQTINREMEKFAKAQGGVYIPNPRMTQFGHRMMATHPLGGCPMGDDAQTGVVDHLGRVFNEDGKVHKGFFVADASIIPHSLGATPLITISALAERIADYINGDQTLGM